MEEATESTSKMVFFQCGIKEFSELRGMFEKEVNPFKKKVQFDDSYIHLLHVASSFENSILDY